MSNRTLAITIAAVVVVAIAVIGIVRIVRAPDPATVAGNQNSNSTSNSNALSNVNNQPLSTPNNSAAQPCQRNFNPETLRTAKVPQASKFVTFQVRNFGTIKAELYPNDAPKTVENIARLVNAGYYDCLTFHRVSRGFVIQGGDPTGTGSGGDSAFGGEFADELNPNTESYKTGYVKGVLAMANHGANTNSSQFFIMLADSNDKMDKAYTIFGKVVAGQDVVDKIGQVEVKPRLRAGDGTPLEPVIIEKATLSNK